MRSDPGASRLGSSDVHGLRMHFDSGEQNGTMPAYHECSMVMGA